MIVLHLLFLYLVVRDVTLVVFPLVYVLNVNNQIPTSEENAVYKFITVWLWP